MIRVALGTAKVLGLNNIKINALPTTAHFMTSGRCRYNCAFCTQAKNSSADANLLSRISWPEYEENKVFDLLRKNQNQFKRACLQAVHSNGIEDFLLYVKKIRANCDIPLSVDLKAENISTIRKTFEAGADIVGLPIDAACSIVHSNIKEGSFDSQINLMKEAAREYKGRISTHLIIGLGETEKDAVELMRELFAHDITLALFAFTPIKGTTLEDISRPSPGHYRKIQLARYLIYNDYAPDVKFDDEGKIINFGCKTEELMDRIGPSAFMTSGCSDCNRPYFNESPGGYLFNYPYTPSTEEFHKAFYKAIEGLEGFNG